MHYNLRKHFFSNRIVACNSLPNIFVSAESINIFRNHLDKFWLNQELNFNFRADITGIGNRSVNKCKCIALFYE